MALLPFCFMCGRILGGDLCLSGSASFSFAARISHTVLKMPYTGECWCDNDSWGPPPPPGPPKNPCVDDNINDDGDPCMCDTWGGCGGGKWGPAVADSTLTVGRRSLKQAAHAAAAAAAAAAASPATGQAHTGSTQRSQSLASVLSSTVFAAAHEFSTTAGGECGHADKSAAPARRERVYASSSSSVCTWAAVESTAWRTASATCAESKIVAHLQAAAHNCLIQNNCSAMINDDGDRNGEQSGERGACWLRCTTQMALAEGHAAVDAAFGDDCLAKTTEEKIDAN
eukprot:SAG31_NODE_3319_length_4419_cov_1.955556_3_plen_285_part_00